MNNLNQTTDVRSEFQLRNIVKTIDRALSETRNGCCYRETAGDNTVPNAAFTAIEMKNKIRDIGDWTSNLLVSKPGMYFVSARVGFTTAAGVAVGVRVKVDGSGYYVCEQVQASNAIINVASASSLVYLERGDTLTVEAYQNSGAAKALLDSYRSEVVVHWLCG